MVSNASYAARGLPNSSIARGSIFAIFGDNLGPAVLAQQPSYPLQTTLAGTAVKVTVNGASVDAIPIYTTKTQVGAVLPSNTPVGDGTVTVTFNGQVSATHAITVAANSFGIFTLNQKGSGSAALTDAGGGYITTTTAARPGQTIVIWGTGLGAINGNDANDQSGGDMTNVPVQVLIGGKPAAIRYRGRAPHIAGLDQINVDVPAGVSGCYVSLIITIGDAVSNSATLPVAPGGGACSDANGLASADLTALAGKSSVRLGYISVGRTVDQTNFTLPPGVSLPPGLGGATTSDLAIAEFLQYTPQQFTASSSLFQQASIGNCIVTTFSGSASTRVDPVTPKFLDAGPVITMAGAGVTASLTRDASLGLYLSTNDSTFLPASGGTFTFSNGSGGGDVGILQNATIGLGSPVVWTNMDQITDVTRAAQGGLPVTWSGGASGTTVEISGVSLLIPSGSGAGANTAVVTFACTAAATDHNFTIPREVLLQLPVSTVIGSAGFSIPSGSLSVGNYTQPVKFTAPGLDLGFLTAYVTNSKSVNYK